MPAFNGRTYRDMRTKGPRIMSGTTWSCCLRSVHVFVHTHWLPFCVDTRCKTVSERTRAKRKRRLAQDVTPYDQLAVYWKPNAR